MKEILVFIKLIKLNKSKQKLIYDKNISLKQLASIGGEISPLITLITNYLYIVIKDLKGDIL